MATTRYDRLLKRRVPEEDRKTQYVAEGYEQQIGENTKYILGAIREVDQRYTQKLIVQGDRVQAQLEKKIRESYPGIQYRRQGSVSNNTHIKYSSDVDLLVIIDKFVMLEHPQTPPIPYTGNPKQELLDLRGNCKSVLDAAYSVANVDDTGSTALCISGGSLICPVDVVPSNWLNTVTYATTKNEVDRGIQVYNRDKSVHISNFPFMFNRKLSDRDSEHHGLVKMMIRLIKTLKYDLEEEGRTIALSSYDICSIIFRAPNAILIPNINRPFEIAEKCAYWMEFSAKDPTYSGSLKVVDDSRIIYDSEEKKKSSILLSQELLKVIELAKKEQANKEYITEAHYKR